MSRSISSAFVLLILLAACGGDAKKARRAGRVDVPVEKLFTLLPASYTGIDFENRLTDTRDFNVFTYRNYYNGGGVGIGDVNGDGLPDVFLTANQLDNRLYLNRGDFWFEDVTKQARVAGRKAWSTGVVLADVNGDGLLDIYVCNAGNPEGGDRANELFINEGPGDDGVPRFTERAAEYGVDDNGFSVHATFFDYDRDGDLDLYVVNNSYSPVNSFGLQNTRHVRHELGGDRLYRNDDGRFRDVSAEAGIYGSEIAFGLAVTTSDFNKDGWPDLYISNDFHERDYLYLNRGDGTFAEVLEDQMRHISLSSMGADAGDLDNDGWPDLYVTDMLPETDRRLKTTSSFETWDQYQEKLRNGYYHQFMRNMLHRNNADGTFTELGQMAGVAATDWSWATLFADLDLDGYKDIFVTNGIYKDVIDQDFIDYFAGVLFRTVSREDLDYPELLGKIPSVRIPNYAFHNLGGLAFTNRAEEWGLATPSFSNGAAYGDLDGDGDLDLVVNNVNHEVFVYRNEADTLLDHRFLKVQLAGEGRNRFGIGAKVTVRNGDRVFYQEQMPARGFQSSVDPVLHFGLGRLDTVESVTVQWPDDRIEVFTRVPTGQTLVADQRNATIRGTEWEERASPARPRFAEVTEQVALDYVHRENVANDFDRHPLWARMLSTEGPALAVGDVNGDGLDDVFLGGAKESPGRLLVQQPGGGFVPGDATAFEQDRISEDVGAAFFDADGDGDLDLYVAGGGSEFSEMAPALRHRLYLNDGTGRFEKAADRLPSLYVPGSCVRPGDFDGDGDLDLFVGGRSLPWAYGRIPRSTLLQNDGHGRFIDVTEAVAPALAKIGMVTDAVWADHDGDGRLDLVVVGEWMPVTVFRNTGGRLEPLAGSGLEKTHGWWNRIVADDFDGDGDLDFVAGNLGRNTKLRATATEPLTLYVGDFDRNGVVDQILAYYQNGRLYPAALRKDLLRQLPYLAKKYPTQASYAGQPITDVLTEAQRRDALVHSVYLLDTVYIENLGDGTFRVVPLPDEAQVAPVYGILPGDFDGDGHMDLLLAGNFFEMQPEFGRLDASHGLLLRGDGRGAFSPVPARESGFRAEGQVRHVAYVNAANGGRLVLLARNNDRPQLFRIL